MKELIAQLKRIASALEEQNHVFVQRCEQIDKNDAAYEQRRFKHDLEIVEEQHAHAKERLAMEHLNLLTVRQIYADHPDLVKAHLIASQGDDK